MTTEAVLYVHDLETMIAFYRSCLGLAPVQAGDGYCGLRAGAIVIWFVRARDPRSQSAAGSGPTARPRSQVPLKLAFQVSHLGEAAGAIDAAGGSVRPASWEFAGYRRRDAVDPEGNVIQLLEALATSG